MGYQTIPTIGDVIMEQQYIIITGANQGIGYAITKNLLQQNHFVAGLDINIEKILDLQQEFPEQLLALACDVTQTEDVQHTIDHVFAKWQRIDVLVNNACIAIFKPFEEKLVEETRREFEVNYFGYIHMINAVLPYMKQQGQGIIHNFSSGVGISGFPGIHGYASTKGAIESLTHTLAIEFEPHNITVNLFHPPLTKTESSSPLGIPTEMLADPDEVGEKFAKKILATKPYVTPDTNTAFGLFAMRHLPVTMGRFFAKMTEKAKNESA
jgi:NAD(P)-dependent dehydrogenase (short-subunit alcohol dehydrogenase family)